MRIVPLKKWHLDNLDMQESQLYIAKWLTPEMKACLENSLSFAGMDGERVLGCAGIIEMWEGRGAVWSMLSGSIGRQFVAVHRAVSGFLDASHYRRLEATVDVGFEEGVRWIEMLGFRLETPCMKGYLPNGGDAAMYVRGV